MRACGVRRVAHLNAQHLVQNHMNRTTPPPRHSGPLTPIQMRELHAPLTPSALDQLDQHGFVVVDKFIPQELVCGSIKDLDRIHAGETLHGDADKFKLSAQDTKIRDDRLIWTSPADARLWGCNALATVSEIVLGIVKPLEERRPNWASLLQAPRKCMVSNYSVRRGHASSRLLLSFSCCDSVARSDCSLACSLWGQGPAGHYVAHRDGIAIERAGAGLAAAKHEMLQMVKQGDWAYSGNFVATMKESSKAMKTMHEAKFSEREITCICCELVALLSQSS